jgi:renalase
MSQDVLIVGAGISGLSLGRKLKEQGFSVTVLEKSRGVGGRCATRRVNDRPVDHGLPFLHGRSQLFIEAVSRLPGASLLSNWPYQVKGAGTPCQPQAYEIGGIRTAVREGVSAFAKELSRGLDVELNTKVEGVELADEAFLVRTDHGSRTVRSVVITCPAEQALQLLEPLASCSREIQGLAQALRTVFTLPSLTLIAGYTKAPALDFHLLLPGDESPIHSLINDSSKRAPDEVSVLVIQSQPQFARELLEAPEELWKEELLHAAAGLLGPWAGSPEWSQAHRWRYARVQRGHELRRPVLFRWPSGARLALCGDAFHPAGGGEGAFLSGLELARRFAMDDGAEIRSSERER